MKKIAIKYKEAEKEYSVYHKADRYELELGEETVRKLASQLPIETLKNIIGKKYDKRDGAAPNCLAITGEREDTEQQKVSDCCGGEVYATSSVWGEKREKIYCKSCGEPCDAVEPEDSCVCGLEYVNDECPVHQPDDMIEKIDNKVRVSMTPEDYISTNREKINEIIEKINNE